MLTLKYKIWLEKKGKVFGPGPYELLRGIEETGSLRGAAKAMGMSYSQAHAMIKMLEQNLGLSLIVRKTGGTEGGHSTLTAAARELMDKYAHFACDCDQALQNIFAKYFS